MHIDKLIKLPDVCLQLDQWRSWRQITDIFRFSQSVYFVQKSKQLHVHAIQTKAELTFNVVFFLDHMLKFTTIITNTPTKHSSITCQQATLYTRRLANTTTCNYVQYKQKQKPTVPASKSLPIFSVTFLCTMGSLFIKPKQHDLAYLKVTSFSVKVALNSVKIFVEKYI